MRSPEGNHELRRLEGNADDIWSRGDAWVRLGDQMDDTAGELTAIGDSSVHKSKGTDKLAELATETAGDLSKAAERYSMTGAVLKTYATALQTAQNWIHPHIDDIEDAENAYQSAVDAKEDAQGDLDGLNRVWAWEEKPTDAQLAKAGSAVSSAASAASSAKGDRDDLWTTFDTTFETWSDAYDDAVDGIQKAMDTADNNDGFWEGVDTFLDVLAVVIIVLSVVALIIGAPLTGLLGLVLLGLTVLSLGLTLLKFAYGRATLSDVAWSAASLIPFGVGKLLSKGVPTLAAVMRGGRGIAAGSIRAGLPSMSLFRPSTWSKPIQWLMAGRTARLALPRPGLWVNPLTSIRMGGPEVMQIQRFLTTMENSSWATNPAVQSFVRGTAGALPGLMRQFGNSTLWITSTGSDLAGVAGLQGDIPGLSDIKLELVR